MSNPADKTPGTPLPPSTDRVAAPSPEKGFLREDLQGWRGVFKGCGCYLTFIVGALLLTAALGYWQKSGRPKARLLGCYANIRVLTMAIEGYNASATAGLANAPVIDRIASDTIDLLTREHWLKLDLTRACPGGPRPPDGLWDHVLDVISFFSREALRPAGPGEYCGENLRGGGKVRCTMHGELP